MALRSGDRPSAPLYPSGIGIGLVGLQINAFGSAEGAEYRIDGERDRITGVNHDRKADRTLCVEEIRRGAYRFGAKRSTGVVIKPDGSRDAVIHQITGVGLNRW